MEESVCDGKEITSTPSLSVTMIESTHMDASRIASNLWLMEAVIFYQELCVPGKIQSGAKSCKKLIFSHLH